MTNTKEASNWKPAVTIDLDTCSGPAFQEAIKALKVWSDKQPEDNCPITENGWYDITPQIAEKLIRRNKKNRTVSLATVKKYGRRMKAGHWRKTGQSGILCGGELYDMQHRLYAGYFTGCTFPCYMVVDVPPQDDLFVYIDDSKPRSHADSLFTAGIGGLTPSPTLAAAVKLAWRYEHGALGWMTEPTIRTMDNDEVLNYARSNPELIDACHDMLTNYSRAVKIISDKGIAGLVAWKIITLHGPDDLQEFFMPLGTGANLDENSPILALRNRLLQVADDNNDLKKLHRLALIIKAFNMHLEGKMISRGRELTLHDKEKYPLFEDVSSVANAAE